MVALAIDMLNINNKNDANCEDEQAQVLTISAIVLPSQVCSYIFIQTPPIFLSVSYFQPTSTAHNHTHLLTDSTSHLTFTFPLNPPNPPDTAGPFSYIANWTHPSFRFPP